MVVRIHSFYACVARQQLREQIGKAQTNLMARIEQSYKDGEAAGKAANPTLPLAFPRRAATTLSANDYYGARYCPRFEMAKAMVLAELHNIAECMSRHTTPEISAQAWHDAVIYLLVLLSAVTAGMVARLWICLSRRSILSMTHRSSRFWARPIASLKSRARCVYHSASCRCGKWRASPPSALVLDRQSMSTPRAWAPSIHHPA